jgi:hypothetical protein
MVKAPTEMLNDLKLAYKEAAPSFMTVCRWVTCFREGTEDFKYEELLGRSITATKTASIKVISDPIESILYINFE